MAPIIGIDLGTTNSCVAIYRNQNVDILPVGDLNQRTLPSFVFFEKEGKIKVGSEAEKRSTYKPFDGVYDSKRMIGRKYSEVFVQECKPKWSFNVKADFNDNCLIEVKSISKDITPEEVSAEILKQIKKDVERQIGESVEDAVITVPAYFTDAQRRSTKEAAKLADLNVLEMINEPTAAALAFSHQKEHLDRTILVYDFGGGTFDVSLVNFDNGVGKVVAKNGNSQLGGRDCDNNLANLILEKVRKATKNSDSDDGAIVDVDQRIKMRQLKSVAREVKEKLSTITSYDFEMDNFINDTDISVNVTRAEFENINMALFQETIDIVDQTLRDGKIDKAAIDDIVLVGGSTRIPKVRDMLNDYFQGQPLSQGINPDEAVAMGAALAAAIITGKYEEKHRIIDITPYSLGVLLKSGEMSVILPKGIQITAKLVRPYVTACDNQKEVLVDIYEGEEKMAKDNKNIGQFTVSGLKPMKAGRVRIDIEFEIDQNSVLNVTATENSNNQSNQCQYDMNYA